MPRVIAPLKRGAAEEGERDDLVKCCCSLMVIWENSIFTSVNLRILTILCLYILTIYMQNNILTYHMKKKGKVRLDNKKLTATCKVLIIKNVKNYSIFRSLYKN